MSYDWIAFDELKKEADRLAGLCIESAALCRLTGCQITNEIDAAIAKMTCLDPGCTRNYQLGSGVILRVARSPNSDGWLIKAL